MLHLLAALGNIEGEASRLMAHDELEIAVFLANTHDTEVRRNAAMVLAHAASNEANRQRIIDLGAVAPLIAICKSNDADSLQLSVWAVAALAQNGMLSLSLPLMMIRTC